MSDQLVEAAKRLVAHWGRRPERSIAYTEAGERAKAMLTHAVRDHDERARLAALSAPSGPVQDQPRVWAMPEIPEDVTRLRDKDGREHRRVGEDYPGVWQDESGYWLANLSLIIERGPLTEVVEPDGR